MNEPKNMNIPLTVTSANSAGQSVFVVLEGGGAHVNIDLHENLEVFKPGQTVTMTLNTGAPETPPPAPEKPVVKSEPRPAPAKAPAKKKTVAKSTARPKAIPRARSVRR